MKVEELMKRRVRVCRPEESLDSVAQVMWEANCGCLPVVDEEQHVTAMITDRDICMTAYFQGGPLCALKVKDAMSKRVVFGKPQDAVTNAEETMRANKVRRLPIVDEENHLVGILSLSDLARAAGEQDVFTPEPTIPSSASVSRDSESLVAAV